MRVSVEFQEEYSRSELLLRSFFGLFYIFLPHTILMIFYALYVWFCNFIAFWVVLFTEEYPRFAFDAATGLTRWGARVLASMFNLVDGYPPFGPNAEWDKVDFEIGYPKIVTRKRILFATFLGPIVTIPQGFVLSIVQQYVLPFVFIANFFIVLFTGKQNESLFKLAVGYLRLNYRVVMYNLGLYFEYPDFSFEETEVDRDHL